MDHIQGLEVSGSHLHCEDAINIVSSEGTIERLSSHSVFDAVDFDFSDLTVNNLVALQEMTVLT